MKKLIKKTIIFSLVFGMLTSCSNKSLMDKPIDNGTLSTPLLNNDNLSYSVNVIESDRIGNIAVRKDKIYYNCIDEENDFKSEIIRHNLDNNMEDCISINSDVLSEYERNAVTSVTVFNEYIIFCGTSDRRNEYGKLSIDSFIGYYDLNKDECRIQLVDDDYLNQVKYDSANRQVIGKSGNMIYSFDMSLNIVNKVCINELLEKYINTDNMVQIDMTVDNEGYIYVSAFDFENNNIFKFDSSFSLLWQIPENKLSEFSGIVRIGTDKNGSVFIYSDESGQFLINVIDTESSETVARYEYNAEGNNFIPDISEECDFVMASKEYIELYNFESNYPVETYKVDNILSDLFVMNKNDIYSLQFSGISDVEKVEILDENGISEGCYEITGTEFSSGYMFAEDGSVYALSEYGDALIHNSSDGTEYIDSIPFEYYELCGVAENYLFSFENNYRLYDITGSLICEFELDTSEILWFSDKTGSEEVYYIDSKGIFNSYSIDSQKNTEIKSVNELLSTSENARVYYAGGLYDFYIETDRHLYSYDIERNLISEIPCNPEILNIRRLSDIAVVNNSGVMAFKGPEGIYLITPEDEINNRKKINMAFLASEKLFPYEYIQSYNEINNNYYINAKKYNSIDELNKDISTGMIPDILISDGNCLLETYEKMGMFADLSKMISDDPKIKSSNYFENLLSMYSDGEKIYRIFPSFYLETPGVIGESGGVSDDMDVQIFYKKVYDSCVIDADNIDIIADLLPFYLNDHFSQDGKMISFDNDEFRSLIKLADKQGDTLLNEDNGYIIPKIEINNFETLSKIMKEYDESFDLIGYPGSDGPYISLKPDICYSISEKCDNLEESWNIVREMFLNEISNGYFSVCREVYEDDMKQAMAEKTMKKNIEKIDKLIRSSKYSFSFDSRIYNIIFEEIQEYSAGNIALDDAVDKIQRRVDLYINER